MRQGTFPVDFGVTLYPWYSGMPKKKPEDKEDVVTVSIRFPREVHAAASKAAEDDDRPLNSYVVRAVKIQNEAANKGAGR